MRRTKRGGWPYSQPPNTAFELNRDSPQADRLVAWWPSLGSRGGKVLRDLSGFGNDGVLIGPTWITSERGCVLDFDGGSSRARVDAASSLDITEAITIALWMYPRSFKATAALVQKGWASAYTLAEAYGTSNLIFNSSSTSVQALGVLTYNTWQRIVVTYDRQNVVFYKNGVDKGGGADTDALGINAVDVSIGAEPAGGYAHDGLISDVRIYNRAFTATEAYEDYRNPWELYKPIIRRWVGWKAAGAAPQTILMDALTAASSTPGLSLVPGTVSLLMNALALTGSVPQITVAVGVSIAMDALTLTSSAEGLTLSLGEVQLAMDALTLASSTGTLSVGTGLTIAMAALTLAGSVPGASLVPGAVTITADALTLASSVLALAVVAGLKVDVDLADALVTLLSLNDAVTGAVALSDSAVTSVALVDAVRD